MSLDVPTLSFDGSPADYALPWPESVTLEHQLSGEVKTTLSGLYELAPPADTEGLSWSLTWDLLSQSERSTLDEVSRLQVVSFRDLLGRPSQGQVSDVRTQIRQGALDAGGRLMYGGSCQLSLFAVSHLPWCPSFALPNKTVGSAHFYGRVGPRDALAAYGFLESSCPVTAGGEFLVCQGGPLTNWGALDFPTPNWDRTARDGAASDAIPTTHLSGVHLPERRGSFFFAFQTQGA